MIGLVAASFQLAGSVRTGWKLVPTSNGWTQRHNQQKYGATRKRLRAQLLHGAKLTRVEARAKKRESTPFSFCLCPLSLRYVRRALMDLKMDEGLKTLLDSGKDK